MFTLITLLYNIFFFLNNKKELMYCIQCDYGCCNYSGYCAGFTDTCDYSREKVIQNTTSVGAIVGGIIGAVIVIIIIIAIVCWWRRRQNQELVAMQNAKRNSSNGQSTMIVLPGNSQPAYGAIQPQPLYPQTVCPQPVYTQPVYNQGYPQQQGPLIIRT